MIALLPNAAFLSEVTRMLAIARALQARGESVAFASHGGPYTRVLDDAGVPWTPLSPMMSDERCARFVQDLVRISRPGVRLQTADEVRQGVAAEVDFLRSVGASAAVIGFTLTAYLSTRVIGIPLVTSHGGSFVPPVLARGLVPVPTTMPMPGAEWLPDWFKRRIVNAGPTVLTHPTDFLNQVADELCVDPVPTLAALMVGDLTLVTDLPDLVGVPADEMAAWCPVAPGPYRERTRLVYTGPLYARLDLPVPDAVQAFLDGSQRTAYIALSSSTPGLLRAVIARVREAGLRAIVAAAVHDVGPVDDPGLVVGGLLPSHLIMPKVDVAVTMGGQGSVQTAMAAGTPLVAMPLHPEQEHNVGIAVRQGMALAVAPRHARTARLTRAVRRVVDEPGFALQAQRVQALFDGVDGAAQAAAAICAYRDSRFAGLAALRRTEEPVSV